LTRDTVIEVVAREMVERIDLGVASLLRGCSRDDGDVSRTHGRSLARFKALVAPDVHADAIGSLLLRETRGLTQFLESLPAGRPNWPFSPRHSFVGDRKRITGSRSGQESAR